MHTDPLHVVGKVNPSYVSRSLACDSDRRRFNFVPVTNRVKADLILADELYFFFILI